MSTKTTFKRIALATVAALGFGLLSVVPSNATGIEVGSYDANIAVSAHTYTSNATAVTATTTTLTTAPVAGKVVQVLVNAKGFFGPTVWGTTNSSGIQNGSVGFQVLKAGWAGLPATSTTTALPVIRPLTSAEVTALGLTSYGPVGGTNTVTGSSTDSQTVTVSTTGNFVGAYSQYAMVEFTPDVAGTWTLQILDPDRVTYYNYTPAITVAGKPGPSTASTVVATLGTGAAGADTVASPLVAPKAASTTDVVSFAVALLNGTSNEVAAGDAPKITATVSGPGVVSWDATGVYGKSVTSVNGTTTHTLRVRPDGQSGKSTITLSWTDAALVTTTIATKTIIFYGTTAKATASANAFVVAMDGSLKDGGRTAEIYLEDSVGNPVMGAAALISGTSSDASVLQNVAFGDCVDDSATAGPGYYACDVKATPGVASGKSASITLKVTAAGTVLATASPVSFSTGGTVVYSAALSFDASSYAPGDKGYVIITMKDKYGNPVADGMYRVFNSSATTATAFAGLTTNQQITTSIFAATACAIPSGTTTVNCTTVGNAGYIWAGGTATAGTAKASFYAPFSSGSFLIKGTTSGTSADLSTDLQAATYGTSISASVEIVNPATAQAQAATDAAQEATDAANAATDAANAAAEAADAATAAAQDAADAVAALSTSVTAMVAALKKQITALTNLVIKIQKKVGA